MAARTVLLPIVLICALALAGCSKDPAKDVGCTADCPPTESSSTSDTGSNTTTTSGATSSNSTTSTAPTPRPAQTFDVNIQNTAFSPASLTIQKGDTVRWTQRDTNLHTVSSKAGAPEPYDSGDMEPVVKPTFTHTFQALGTHEYFCKRHTSMTGTITVVEALPA